MTQPPGRSYGHAFVYLGLFLLLLRPWPAQARASTELAQPEIEALERYVEQQMAEARLPGLALALVQDDQIVYQRGFGQADPTGRPVTPQTPFTIGSTSKSFTALAVLQLVESGAIELEAPAQRYLPWFQLADPAAAAQITVRQLLIQTSGLPTVLRPEDVLEEDGPDALEQHMRGLSTIQLASAPGARFQYSNLNFDLLGLIVQVVAGVPYERHIEQQIFAPLEMRHSFATREAALDNGLATGYRYWFGRPVPYEMPINRGETPAGFLHASAEDLGHYLIAQLNGGRYAGRSVLSPAGIAELHRPAIQIEGQDLSYGMGWFVKEQGGVPLVLHGGSVANFHSNLVLAPTQRRALAVVMNGENGLHPQRMEAIADGLTALLLGQTPGDSHQSTARADMLKIIAGVLVLQLVEIALTLRRLLRRPAGGGWRGWRLWLRVSAVLLLLLGWAALLLGFAPLILGARPTLLPIFAPDLGYPLLLSSGLALGWGALRSVLLVRAYRAGSKARSEEAAHV